MRHPVDSIRIKILFFISAFKQQTLCLKKHFQLKIVFPYLIENNYLQMLTSECFVMILFTSAILLITKAAAKSLYG